MKFCKILLSFCILFSILGLSGIAGAQDVDKLLGMELESSAITMEIGETHTFTPIFETEEITGITPTGLHLFSSNENVVRPVEELNAIEAIGGGKATVYVFSWEYEFSAECEITVSGAGKNLIPKGEIWKGPSEAQLKKLHDPALLAFYGMLAKPEMAPNAANIARSRTFTTVVSVTEGRAESLAGAMEKLGMGPVYAFEWAAMISVTGTPEQYLKLLESDNILSLEENTRFDVNWDDTGNYPLEGQAETISHFSLAHAAGLYGSGSTVAIFDNGFFTSHEQFTEKPEGSFIAQACFSTSGTGHHPTCKNGTIEDTTSAEIGSLVGKPENFTHGTHVASIAAGSNGVAPNANIIAVNVFTETYQSCSAGTCYGTTVYWTDLVRGIDWLLRQTDAHGNIEGTHVTAANFSLGDYSKNSKVCSNYSLAASMSQLLAKNIIPTISSGNEYYDGYVTYPACVPAAFTVGALWDSGEPQVADYSNHASLVDILAPGTSVFAGTRVTDAGSRYGRKNGTSMAAPMVTGSFALLNGKFPNLSAKELQTMLTGMSTMTAARKSVKKPVLDFTNIQGIVEFMESGPQVEVYGGDKSLKLVFPKVPFNTSYKVTLSGEDGSVKTVSKNNIQALTIKSLTNDVVYTINVQAEIILAKQNVPVPAVQVKGMPMTQAKEFTMKQTSGYSAQAEEAYTLGFSYTNSGEGYLLVEYGLTENDLNNTLEDALTYIVPNLPTGKMIYANMYKAVKVDGDIYKSLPTAKRVMLVPDPARNNYGTGNGRIWLSLYPEDCVTSIEATLYQQDNSGNLIKKVKKTTIDTKKKGTDIVFTGAKNGTSYYVAIRYIAKVGKDTFRSYLPTSTSVRGWGNLVPMTQTPVYDEHTGKREVASFENNITGVSAVVGDKSMTLNYGKNLAVDGYRFDIKPIIPNQKLISKDVAISKAAGSFRFTGLTNGTLYKLRFQEFVKNGSKIAVSRYFPEAEYDMSDGVHEDNSWKGLTFVPLAVPQVEFSRYYNSTDNEEYVILNVTNVPYADGFVVTRVSDKNGYALNVPVEWEDAEKTMYVFSRAADRNYTVYVQLYKEVSIPAAGATQKYLGPVFAQSFIFEGADFVLYGPKDVPAEEYDMAQDPFFADYAQINGIPVFDEPELESKAAFVTMAEECTSAIAPEELPFEDDPEIMIGIFEESEEIGIWDISDESADDLEGTGSDLITDEATEEKALTDAALIEEDPEVEEIPFSDEEIEIETYSEIIYGEQNEE